jgi:hypothetical protein
MNTKKKVILGIGALAVLITIGVGIAGWKLYYDLKNKDEAKRVINEVSRIYKMPDETPTVATVKDINKLKDQPFFKDAKNGDNLLIFSVAKQALIYREKTNLIINVGPITISATPTPSASPSAAAAATKTPTASSKE